MEYQLAHQKYSDEIFAIETERLRLSVYRAGALKKVSDYVIRNRDFHKRFSQPHDDSYFTLKEQRRYMDSDIKAFKRGDLIPLWITLKEDHEHILGRVSFFNIAMGGMMLAQIGYHMDEQSCGNGYMTEAVKGACAMMFDIMKLHRIEAFILPENKKSIDLIQRAGFIHEGLRYSYMNIDGRYRDHETFYLLNT